MTTKQIDEGLMAQLLKEAADEHARLHGHEAPVREAQGYDFGYQSPGSIHKFDADQGGEYAGLYEVTLP